MPSDSTGSPSPVSLGRRVFSFPTMLAGLLLVLAVLTVRSRFDDPDMWWHLKTGQIIWNTHSIPATDLFSYTTNHHAYVPHEWLSQVLTYGAFRVAGYSGLMAWLYFFTSAQLIAGYFLCSLYSGNAKVAFLGSLLIWLFATVGFSIRPQMIGYLLLTVELLLLHLGRTRDPRWVFALPVLFAVWINCHGSFFLGIAVAGISLFSSWFNFQYGSLTAIRWNPRQRRLLTWALMLSVAALFLNPDGIKQILYPLNLILGQPVNVGNVQEWQPLQMTGPRGLGLLGLVGCIFLLLVVRRSKLFLDELLLLCLGVWLGVSHERTVFVFGILVAPILSRLLSDSWDQYSAEQDLPLPNAVLIVLSVLVAVWAFPNRQNLTAQIEENNPVGAVEFIKTHSLSGPMLNDYVFGGYLIWSAPEHPVFIDGRTDIFEWTGVLQEYGEWATLRRAPDYLLDKYRISFCLLRRQSPITFVMPLMPNWKVVYSDDSSVIFQRTPATLPPL